MIDSSSAERVCVHCPQAWVYGKCPMMLNTFTVSDSVIARSSVKVFDHMGLVGSMLRELLDRLAPSFVKAWDFVFGGQGFERRSQARNLSSGLKGLNSCSD
jgi:hypothetical protein